MKQSLLWSAFGVFILLIPIQAQDNTIITIENSVTAPSPERFGANLVPTAMSDLNMWIQDGTEPTITRLPGVASGGGADFIINEADPQTDHWDTLGEGFFDGGRVRVYRVEENSVRLVRDSEVRAYHATDATGYRIELADSGEVIQAGDRYIVERLHQDTPNALAHPRLDYLQDWDSWRARSVNGETPSLAISRVPDAVVGQSSLMIVSQDTGEVGVSQYNVYPPSDGTNAYDPAATYTLDLWLKQEQVADGRVHIWFGSYPQVDQWFDVTDTWTQYQLTFTGLPPLKPNSSVNTVNITFAGGGTVWMDNPRIYNNNAAPYALIPEAKQALLDYRPGTVRIWSGHTNTELGQTLESWLAEPGAAQNHYDVNNGMIDATTLNLPEALTLIQEVGGTPWLIVNPSFSEQEWLNLIEYLSGSVDTPYGALRAERGQSTPWTDVFDHIRIELGNETWNGIFTWTYPWDGSVGKFARYFYGIAETSPSFVRDKIDFVIGGFVLMADAEYGYGQMAMRYAPQANTLGVTAYVGGWDSVDISGDDVEAKYRNLLTFTPQILMPLGDAQAASRDLLAAQDIPYQLAIYEGGPGYALPSPENPYDPETERIGKSLASATTTLEAFLYNTSIGYGPQAYFTFAPGANWTSHTTITNGYRPHLPWLALQLRNQHCTGDMITTAVAGSPTIDLPAIETDQTFAAINDLPLIASYAFRDDSQVCVFVLSRSLDQSIPVTLNIPDAPSGVAMLYRLAGDARQNNIDSQVIAVESEPLEALDGYTFTMPPGSIYVFTVQAE